MSVELDSLSVPAPVLLELLRSEKVAVDKSNFLQKQLENMKEIDLNGETEDL